MRKDCKTFNDIVNRINSLHLTGNFGEDEFMNMAKVEFSVGSQVNTHLYEKSINKEYMFNNRFDFEVAYPYLSGNSTHI